MDIFLCLFDLKCFFRGQESAGIVTGPGDSSVKFDSHKGMGLVDQIFTADALSRLKGNIGISE